MLLTNESDLLDYARFCFRSSAKWLCDDAEKFGNDRNTIVGMMIVICFPEVSRDLAEHIARQAYCLECERKTGKRISQSTT